MTIPTRPAPPPPNRIAMSSNQSSSSSYGSNLMSAGVHRKPAPPRPPPPKIQHAAPVKKSASQKSISILSNLFGSKNNSKSIDKVCHTSSEQRIPPKIPAPPSIHSSKSCHQIKSDVVLINFDESPTTLSPPTIKKSNTGSDSDSMESFCSTSSSPNNLRCASGAMSQAESGFEDDFDFKTSSAATSRSTTFSNDPFDCLDDFSGPVKANNMSSNIRNVKPFIHPKPSSIGSANFYTCTSSVAQSTTEVNYDESLSNGKNLIKPSTFSMPTIIKPPSGKGKASPVNLASVDSKKIPSIYEAVPSADSYEDDDFPSLPMPSMPPPPPPVVEDFDSEETSSYGIALYDFQSDVIEDLNIKANEKVYLLKQMNEEWMYGRNKRGCEGIFPISYVDIKNPLKQSEVDIKNASQSSRSASVSPSGNGTPVRALFNFTAETDEDLTIKENEFVNVMYEINSEWLYGSNISGELGQFPANFIECIPQNLPPMPK